MAGLLRRLFFASLGLGVLRPHLEMLPSQVDLIGGTMLQTLPALLIVGVLASARKASRVRQLVPPFPASVRLLSVGLIVWVIVATGIAFLAGTSDVTVSNVGELFRYPLYFGLLIAGYYAAGSVSDRTVGRWITATVVVSGLVALVQLFDVPVVGQLIKVLYGTFKSRGLSVSPTDFRVIGTFRNPNWFGSFLAMIFPLVVYYNKKATLWRRVAVYSVLGVAIISSGSRTAWIGLVVGLTAHGLWPVLFRVPSYRPRALHAFGTAAVLILFGVMAANAVDISYRRITQPVEAVMNYGGWSADAVGVESLDARIDNWERYWRMGLERPLSGFGPSQDWIGIPHNGFVLVFVKYGIPGLVLILATGARLIVMLAMSKHGISAAIAGLLAAGAVVNMAEDLIDTLQVMAVACLVVGYGLGRVRHDLVTKVAALDSTWPRNQLL